MAAGTDYLAANREPGTRVHWQINTVLSRLKKKMEIKLQIKIQMKLLSNFAPGDACLLYRNSKTCKLSERPDFAPVAVFLPWTLWPGTERPHCEWRQGGRQAWRAGRGRVTQLTSSLPHHHSPALQTGAAGSGGAAGKQVAAPSNLSQYKTRRQPGT